VVTGLAISLFPVFPQYLGRKPFNNPDGSPNMLKNCTAEYDQIKENECDKDFAELIYLMLNKVYILIV
jgi:hypothetical protein